MPIRPTSLVTPRADNTSSSQLVGTDGDPLNPATTDDIEALQDAIALEGTLSSIESSVATDSTLSSTLPRGIVEWTAGDLPVTQQDPITVGSWEAGGIGVSQDGTSQIDDADSGTGSANAASLSLGDIRTNVDIHVDTSGDATLTVEVSRDGGTSWVQFDTVQYQGSSEEIEQYSTAYEDIRAYLDQNRNGVEMVSRGN